MTGHGTALPATRGNTKAKLRHGGRYKTRRAPNAGLFTCSVMRVSQFRGVPGPTGRLQLVSAQRPRKVTARLGAWDGLAVFAAELADLAGAVQPASFEVSAVVVAGEDAHEHALLVDVLAKETPCRRWRACRRCRARGRPFRALSVRDGSHQSDRDLQQLGASGHRACRSCRYPPAGGRKPRRCDCLLRPRPCSAVHPSVL